MIWLIGIVIWAVGVVYGFVDRWRCWKYRRSEWNNRNHGLIAFSDVQMYWLIAFWPLAWAVGLLFILGVWILAGLESLVNACRKE